MEFAAILQAELLSMRSQRRREFIQSRFVEPYQTLLRWEYGADEEYMAWVFADLKERDVVAQYCRGGHGAHGTPWGVNFRTHTYFGQDSGWYRNLDELVADWGVDA